MRADEGDQLMRKMELLEKRILSPPIRNNTSIASPALDERNSDDNNVFTVIGRDESRGGLDNILCMHQNSGSQHSFSFDNSTKALHTRVGENLLNSNSSAHWSHAPSHSLIQANQIVSDHLQMIGEKLLIPTATAPLPDSSSGMRDDGKLNYTLDSHGKALAANSLPSSVSATMMSSTSMASNLTLVTAHLEHQKSIMPRHGNNGDVVTSHVLDQDMMEYRPSSSTLSLQEGSKNGLHNHGPMEPHVSPLCANFTNVVSGLSSKRKSITPNKRTLTSITDSSLQSEVNKKRNATSNPSVDESRNVGGNDSSTTAAPMANDMVASADATNPIQALVHERTASQPVIEHVSASRGSSSNPPFSTSAGTTVKKSSVKPPANNTNNAVITSFFTKASDKHVISEKNAGSKPLDENGESKTSTLNITIPSISNQKVYSIERENLSLKAQVNTLEASLKDAKDQLNAVSNNQTIVHTHLRAQLAQCEKTIAKLQDEMKGRNHQTMNVIELLIRKQSTREQVELRQQLASDGARLGRLVFNRVGMHSVESWEDGLISKNLKRKKEELRKKKDLLRKKQSDMTMLRERTLESFDNDILSESIEMQIEDIQRQEAVVEKEEEDVYLQKASHIKALKRLASEDASRFSSRPKLNDRYVPMSLLGKGGFSEVWLAYDLMELREVAMKIHQLDPRWSEAKIENYTKHVAREYEIHRDVRHPRIVSLYDVFEIDNNSFATVLEYCKGTDLDTLLKERKLLPERRARLILLQILSGMKYLSTPSSDKSRQGIIHYDLKPGNILFDENGDAKITDFGLSKILDSQDPAGSMELTSQGAGTYWYLPPECFMIDECVKISNKVDVWSIGVIFYQMLFGKRPFGDGLSQDKVLSNSLILKAKEVRFPKTPQVSERSQQFIQSCLTYEQHDRPTIAELCKHPYITETKESETVSIF